MQTSDSWSQRRYKDALNHRSKWSCCHSGCLALRVTSPFPRNRRFAPLGFYWIPTYFLISVYRLVRAVEQFNHWLNSTWHRPGSQTRNACAEPVGGVWLSRCLCWVKRLNRLIEKSSSSIKRAELYQVSQALSRELHSIWCSTLL